MRTLWTAGIPYEFHREGRRGGALAAPRVGATDTTDTVPFVYSESGSALFLLAWGTGTLAGAVGGAIYGYGVAGWVGGALGAFFGLGIATGATYLALDFLFNLGNPGAPALS